MTTSDRSESEGASRVAEPRRVVCFDLGGVVVRICRSFREGSEAAGVAQGIDLDRTIDRAALAPIVERHQSGVLDDSDFHASVSALVQGRVAPEQLRRIHDAWILGEYEGVAELIQHIHAAGVETACLSNTNDTHWRSMHGMRAFDSIRHRHASHLLGICKPDRAIFRAFESRTGFAPESIIYFDDLIENVLAAGAAGWNAELVDPLRPTAPQMRLALERHGVLHA